MVSTNKYKTSLFVIFILLSILWENKISGLFLIILILIFILSDLRVVILAPNKVQINKIRVLYFLRIISKILLIFLIISINSSLFIYFSEPNFQLKYFLVILWLTCSGLIIIPFLILRGKWDLRNQVPPGL